MSANFLFLNPTNINIFLKRLQGVSEKNVIFVKNNSNDSISNSSTR